MEEEKKEEKKRNVEISLKSISQCSNFQTILETRKMKINAVIFDLHF